MNHTLENHVMSITVSDHGAELISIYDKEKEREVLWQADAAFWNRHAPLFVGRGSRGEGAVVKKGKGRTRYSQSYQNVAGHRFVAVEQQIKQKPHRRRSDKVRQVIGRTEKFHSPNAVEGEQG